MLLIDPLSSRLASNVEDIDLLNVVAEYIEEHFELVTKSNEFLVLPKIRVRLFVLLIMVLC